ncbi:amylo-alpha-1,6-glucosidase [Arthrobacter sp. H14]|uniref:amylo-alpha-1,6-glucosidase n=1 Tax=Arthrobacter sp. H14 TaxID=1312959 RepID=UPI0004B5C16B|nr:glycogen debranching N-terminal domain-containing protein [Arthrobacter sp. H14]
MASTQPFLHNLPGVFLAPYQAWSASDGQIGGGAEGIYCSDDRVISGAGLSVAGYELRWLSTQVHSATAVDFHYIVMVPSSIADPLVTVVRERRATTEGISEQLRIESAHEQDVRLDLKLTLTADNTPMEQVKDGRTAGRRTAVSDTTWNWRDENTTATLEAPGAKIDFPDGTIALNWIVDVAAGSGTEAGWTLRLEDLAAPIIGTSLRPLPTPAVVNDDPRLKRLMHRAFSDLSSLRIADRALPNDVFLAAGAPWFYTMFGRDSLIAARMLLTVDTTLAAGTLRTLAARQGTKTDVETAEQPGKILHEVRRTTLKVAGHDGVQLPPVYYGTIDATPLWISLLHDAWQADMPESEVEALLDNLEAALNWLGEYGDSDGDGFLEYLDTTGHGLANQGWKDSGDSIRWHNGSLAEGPIALSEVQGYAYEAAIDGAALLEAFGRPGAERWRKYAAEIAERFRASFWCEDELGRYPAIALDAEKKPVDGVSSNMGHLLGTGILNEEEKAAIARRLLHPTMFSGYGIRTVSTTNGGYWPLRYHAGSVWSHDTAMILAGLLRDGFADEAETLALGLLRAADGFDYRLPELFSGDSADKTWPPIAYPASCRPQAWAAASAVPIAVALGGLR